MKKFQVGDYVKSTIPFYARYGVGQVAVVGDAYYHVEFRGRFVGLTNGATTGKFLRDVLFLDENEMELALLETLAGS